MRNITLMKDLASIFLDECVSDPSPFLLYVGFGDPHRCDFGIPDYPLFSSSPASSLSFPLSSFSCTLPCFYLIFFLYFFSDIYGATQQWGTFCELYGSGGEYGVIPDWDIIRYDPDDVRAERARGREGERARG
jgi:hypothetical protein